MQFELLCWMDEVGSSIHRPCLSSLQQFAWSLASLRYCAWRPGAQSVPPRNVDFTLSCEAAPSSREASVAPHSMELACHQRRSLGLFH